MAILLRLVQPLLYWEELQEEEEQVAKQRKREIVFNKENDVFLQMRGW